MENVQATAVLGAQILLAPHRASGTHSMIPFMKTRSMSVWGSRDRPRRTFEDAFHGTTEAPSGCYAAAGARP